MLAQYSSKKQVQAALTSARKRLKQARQNKNEAAIQKALKDCQDIQYVYDRWDSLHSRL